MAFPRRARVLTVAAVTAAIAAVTAGVVTDRHHGATADQPGVVRQQAVDPGTIDASIDGCGNSWTPGPAGVQTITLLNTDFRPADVRVVGVDPAHRRQVFAELENFGPSTTATIRVRLAAGQYALQCYFEDQSPVTGTAVTITGPGAGVRGVVPITANRLVRPSLRYTHWVLGQLPALVSETDALAAALGRNDRTAAREHWLRAHADYERLGAAYDAFGDLDGEINGLPAGLPRGTRDVGFTGFHRVELGLWGDGSNARLRDQARALTTSVHGLQQQLGSTQLDPLTLTIRAHEITENLLQTELTGKDDLGSHSDLATIAAGLDGTRTVLGILKKQLAPRLPHTDRLFAEVARARLLVTRLARTSMGDEAVSAWPQARREQVDAAIAQLTEDLAPVAAVLEPRRTS